MNILRQADETHQYEQDLGLGKAEELALMHADSLLYIISEKTIYVWQKMIDKIWADSHRRGDQLCNISQCWIVYM